jgi:hypothetical protein
MCIHARTLFECHHQVWGSRIKPCANMTTNDTTVLPSQTPPRLHRQINSISSVSSSTCSSAASSSSRRSQSQQQEDYCPYRTSHGLHSRRLPRKCDKCKRIDDTIQSIKERLAEMKEILILGDRCDSEPELSRLVLSTEDCTTRSSSEYQILNERDWTEDPPDS